LAISDSLIFHAHDEDVAGAASDARVRLERVIRDNYAVIWRLARRWGLNSADADDVAQRTIVIAGNRLADIEPHRERAFLCRTALHLAGKVRRSHRQRGEDFTENWEQLRSGAPDPEQLLEERRARAQLDAFLEQLPESLRAVFVLFELEMLSQVEVSEALGIPQGTVASRLRRAREMMAVLIERNARSVQKIGAYR
jgi:RNA polymerase sigma-70 factor (ECF subfamily)